MIKNSGETKHHDQIFGDFDGDGEVELVFWNQRAGTLEQFIGNIYTRSDFTGLHLFDTIM